MLMTHTYAYEYELDRKSFHHSSNYIHCPLGLVYLSLKLRTAGNLQSEYEIRIHIWIANRSFNESSHMWIVNVILKWAVEIQNSSEPRLVNDISFRFRINWNRRDLTARNKNSIDFHVPIQIAFNRNGN